MGKSKVEKPRKVAQNHVRKFLNLSSYQSHFNEMQTVSLTIIASPKLTTVDVCLLCQNDFEFMCGISVRVDFGKM